ncbi:hypothetical protein CR513_28171, partial [Mucuna pruriens]
MMRARFVPSTYIGDLHDRLHRLYQGTRSVEEYHNELVHQVIKVEMQIRRRSATKRTYGGSSSWKGKDKDKDKARREKSPKKGSKISIYRKALTPTPTPIPLRTSNIKCFKCLGKGHIASEFPNKYAMIVKEDREIRSESSTRKASTTNEFEGLSDGSHYKGDILVVRRLMNSQVGEEAETQNIFHSRCLILGNLCSIIITRGSFVNVVSERLVKKLALPTTIHPSEKGDLLVDRQTKVIFTLGAYEDRQFDKKVVHDEVTNRFTFMHVRQRVVLKPLSPSEVQKDQKKI